MIYLPIRFFLSAESTVKFQPVRSENDTEIILRQSERAVLQESPNNMAEGSFITSSDNHGVRADRMSEPPGLSGIEQRTSSRSIFINDIPCLAYLAAAYMRKAEIEKWRVSRTDASATTCGQQTSFLKFTMSYSHVFVLVQSSTSFFSIDRTQQLSPFHPSLDH